MAKKKKKKKRRERDENGVRKRRNEIGNVEKKMKVRWKGKERSWMRRWERKEEEEEEENGEKDEGEWKWREVLEPRPFNKPSELFFRGNEREKCVA